MDLTQNMTGRNCSLFVVFSIWHEKHDLENVSVFSDRPSSHIVLGSFFFYGYPWLFCHMFCISTVMVKEQVYHAISRYI